MSFNSCMVSLGLNGKIPATELRDVAAQYEKGGMGPELALQRAVEDKLQLLQMEERRIVAAVRSAWEASGGAKRAPKQGETGLTEQYLREKVLFALDPKNYGGTLTPERIAGIIGNPDKPGTTVDEAAVTGQLQKLEAAKLVENVGTTQLPRYRLRQAAAAGEVTSETARRGFVMLENGQTASILEHAERGYFTVTMGGEAIGTFYMNDAGKISKVSARLDALKDDVREAGKKFAQDAAEQNDPLRVLAHGRDSWIPKGDLKTYTASEAQKEWDQSSLGFRRTMMGRIERDRDDPMAGKKWDQMTPIERKLAHGALNEDFYWSSWYVNKQGKKIMRDTMQAEVVPEKTPEEIAAARWDAMQPTERESMLYAHGIDHANAQQAKYLTFDKYGPDLRAALAKTLAQVEAPAAVEASPAPAEPVAAKPKKKGGIVPGEAVLRQDWGVDGIDGWAATDEFPIDGQGDHPQGGVKAAFLKDTQRYLKDVVGLLLDAGWTNSTQRNGKAMKPISVNEGGDAGSGDVSMTMFNEQAARGIYVTIGANHVAQHTSAGVSVMMRVTDAKDPFGGRENLWMDPSQTSRALADKIIAAVDRVTGAAKPTKLATNVTTEQDNGPSNTRGAGAQALGDLAPAADGGPQGGRGVHGSDGGGGRARAQGDRAADDQAGVQGTRGAGSGAAEVHPAAAGTAAGGRLGGRRAGREGARVSGNDEGSDGTRVKDVAPAVPPAPLIPATNFRITEDVRLGQGGEVEKFNDNLAAIRTLKTIEQENRRATPEEQAQIARYVGWGGLANAFPSPETGEFKDAWKKRGAELAELLTPKEYAQARRSTLDSHYTSQTVVDAMWSAVRHLGVKGGLFLESSMGIGNFLGRMPIEIAGNAKFVGVEYDSLTARMASLLYPAETVLNSGFQNVPLPDGAFDMSIGNPPFGEQSLRFQFKPELNGLSIHNQFFVAALDAVKPHGVLVQVVSRYLMDSQDKSARIALAKRGKLLGAIRLPDTAFKENARTEVVTDIVFLQRYTPGEQAAMEAAFEAANTKPLKNYEKEQERRALADSVPEWVNTKAVKDPLGGEPMAVNHYFATHPDMIMGTLERSGSMRHGNDITVRLGKTDDLGARLAGAIAALPQGVAAQDQTAIDRSKARFEDMSAALRITLAGHETGSIKLLTGDVLEQVIERETPEGAYELTQRTLAPTSPWSESLYMDSEGKWYTVAPKLDDDGKPVKQMKDGKPTKLNVYERSVYENEADIPASMLLGEARFERLKQLVKMRDLLKEQLAMESENHNASLIETNRATLRGLYEAFVKKNGLISEPANSSLVNGMPDGALVQALEFGYRPAITAAQAARTGEKVRAASATPAPILSQRVIFEYKPAESAATLADAISINRAESGRIDIERLASLLGKSVKELEQDIEAAEHPLLFRDPETDRWETRNDYLSGAVKRKLNTARAMGLAKNVEALEAVQPEAWGAENVTALLGSSWIPPFVYSDFVEHITGAPARVAFSAITNSYSVNAGGALNAEREGEWGSPGYTAAGLISDILNSSQIKVTYKDSDGRVHVDGEKTALALLKAKAINAEWADWVYKDGERRKKLVELFNEKFNTRVIRQHDGSHLILPGKVPDAVIAMRRHQKNAIWRGVSERTVLFDHTVGAGKTFTAIARAMERRRMGLSQKPAITVPNHMVEQFAADVYRLYPGAKVLAAGKADFEKKRRRKLFAKIATGDWDIVIIPHSSFGFIDIAPETEERYLQMELDAAMEAVKEAQDEADANGEGGGFRKPFGVKEAERLVEKITQRMDKVRGNKAKDRLLTFEQLGIDDLTVDEAHEFKNLFYSSRLTNVKGMGNKTGSQKAFDLYNKVRVLLESPTGSVCLMTGTPISNSAVEMYTMMRYLAPDQLAELGLEHFDAWRAQYVSTDPGWEPTETGRLKEVNRLGRTWSNMRSLMELYYSFADVVDNDDIKKAYAEDNDGAQFPIPPVKGGDRQSIVIQPTKAQIALLDAVLEGFDGLPNIKDPYDRNKTRLRLMDRARKVSLDVRAADPHNKSDEKGGKLDVLADHVKRIYDKWDADRGTQLVFLDRSVPKSKGDDAMLKEYDALLAAQRKALEDGDEGAQRRADEALERFDPNEMEELRNAQAGGWNAYQQIKDNLIARGIPANEIRFVQEANTDAQKQALFDSVNAGTVRVLIGSSPRMGAGTNVQQRLVALHHADVTWKPSDIEQREGRIIRQGNKLLEKYGMDKFEVEILAYATERTIDAKMWSLNSSKLKTINAIRKYDGAFSMDFEDEDSVSMAELAALASGDPLLLERVKLMSEIDKLELLKRQHARKEWAIIGQIEDAQKDIERLPRRIEAAAQDVAAAQAGAQAMEDSATGRTVAVEGVVYTSGTEARKAVYQIFKDQGGEDENAKVSISVGKRRLTSLEGALNAVGSEMGDEQMFSMTVESREYIARTDAARAIAELAKQRSVGLDKDDAVTVDLGEFYGMPLQGTFSRFDDKQFQASLAVLRPDGTTLTSGETKVREDWNYTTSAMRTALDELERLLQPKRLEYVHETLAQRLARAQASLPDLEKRRPGAFKEQAELDAKNERLQDVIRLLSSGPVTPARNITLRGNPLRNADGSYRRQAPVPPAYSMGGSVVVTPDKMLPVEAIAKEVADRIGQFAHQPRIIIRDTAYGVLPGATAQSGISGSVHEGDIYLFRDALPSLKSVQVTLFHELVHYGLRRFLTKEQYIEQMMQLYHADDSARGYAEDWMLRPEGQETIRTHGIDRARAQGVDEFLAHIAEPNAGGYLKSGFTDRVARAVVRWLGKLAGWMGMPKVRSWLMGKKNPEVRELVQSIFHRLETDAPATDKWLDGANVYRREGLGDALAGAANNAANLRLPAGYVLGDLFNKSGKIGWWHKTIGTMDNLAKRHPAFAPVYNAVQAFLGDVSRFATVAADEAPRLLPKLEDIKDILGKDRKKPLTAADTKAIAAPIFEGTLTWARDNHGHPIKIKDLEEAAARMTVDQKAQVLLRKGVITDEQNRAWRESPLDFYDATIERRFNESQLKAGVVWSDAELRGMFQLNDEQIELYREFRRAADKSLANLTITEMVKMGGEEAEGLLEGALDAGGVMEAAELLRDHFIKLAQDMPDLEDMHLDTAKKIMDLADRAQDLMDRGYAPLSRFGKYTVYVQEQNDLGEMEQVYFGMFESSFEAARMARQMTEAHPKAQVSQGTVSEEAYKLFAGIAPETIELFGSMVGLDDATPRAREVYETYLKLAKSNRSAMKRMIQRKGIAGFNEDAGRVLASFIYSNARLSAGNAHLGKIDEAVNAIPQQQGELKDAAMELRGHIKDPQGGGSVLGGLMFAQFLGGSVASALVNLTQPFTMTLPYLSQWGGITAAGKQLATAIRLSAKDKTGDARLDAALKWATEEGIVAPQEVHYLQAQAAGKGQLRAGDGTKVGNARAAINNAITKVSIGWGKLFAMAELTNRRVTFIAAYQTAIEQGIANPAGFAEEAVRQTQGTYNSGNKPRWARSTLGGLAMTFKQYSIAYLELLARMATAGAPGSPERAAGRRAALYMIAVLFLMAGADGLPFEQDLEDALDGIMQRLGYNFSTKREKQAFLTELLGQGGADFALKGISAMPGMPIDVAGRFGMGNLIPATGLLTKKQSYTSDLGELAGPAGDIAKRAFTATGKLLGGDIAGAALDVSPQSVRNVAKGVDMLDTGSYKDTRGYKVNDVTPTESVLKMIGFQPSSTADIQDNKGQALDMISQTRMASTEISERWAQGIANGDDAMIREARSMRDDWNAKNPETPIRVDMPGVIKRARAMRQDVINRTKMTAPKALKAAVRAELAQTRQ